MSRTIKPLIGITLGDCAGIGPEVAVKAADQPSVRKTCIPLLIGDRRMVQRAAEIVGCRRPLKCFGASETVRESVEGSPRDNLLVLHLGDVDPAKVPLGKLSRIAGKAAYDWVCKGAALANSGVLDALVTAPLNKEAVLKAGIKGFKGHTELLAEIGSARTHAMMLASGAFRVVLVTTHIAIKQVPKALTAEGIVEKTLLTHQFLRSLGIENPRIAVAALNPHGGEHGSFGDEEQRIIQPALVRLRRRGIQTLGPLPSDTLFALHVKNEPFDAIIVMYHDQGLIPLKLLSFGKGVNITLGLPFIRTSPDHGTAFEIAGKGVAGEGSMVEAIKTAVQMFHSTHPVQ